MELVLRRSKRYLHVSVIDEDRRPARLRGPASAHAAGGRGLMLVEAFSVAWGCTPTDRGKYTWATVATTPRLTGN
jgi:hypothetical protein